MKSKKNSKQLSKETRKKLKTLGRRSRKFIHLVCIKCNREYSIRINREHEDLYTDKVIKNYVCLLCR
jgi:arginyl-tRNA--protein-N-Asp/Glu arginylyltransferase